MEPSSSSFSLKYPFNVFLFSIMYTSSWQTHSSSSYPRLWAPPLATSVTLNAPVRLPSVNQVLERICGFANNPEQPQVADSRNTSTSTVEEPINSNKSASSRSPSVSTESVLESTLFLIHHQEPPAKISKKRGRKRKASVICTQCALTQTPEWRRGPEGARTLCNACGLYFLKLAKKFGSNDACLIFLYKKCNNNVSERVIPTAKERIEYCSLGNKEQ